VFLGPRRFFCVGQVWAEADVPARANVLDSLASRQ